MDPGFSMKSLQRAAIIVDNLIQERIKQWNCNNENIIRNVDLFNEMVSLTADTIGFYTFSQPFYKSLSKSFKIVLSNLGWKIWQESLLPYSSIIPTPANLKYWFHLYKLKSKISDIIQSRLKMSNVERNQYSDILSQMIMDDSDKISIKMEKNHLRDEIIGLIFAGHDTTASTLSWIFYLLAENTEIQAKAREEIIENFGSDLHNFPASLSELEKLKYINAIIKETLRLYPPATIGRTSLCDTVVNGFKIPKGSELFINIYAMQRNKYNWGSDCLVFNPDRFLKPLTEKENLNYLPFGGAPRSCIGMRLAVIEMKIVMSYILTNFQLKPSSNGKNASINPALTLHPVDIFVDMIPISE